MSIEVYPSIPEIDIAQAERVAVATGNPLLLDHCNAYQDLQQQPPVPALREGAALRWLDTPLTAEDGQLTPDELLRGKIHRTLAQVVSLQEGVGFMCITVAPAYNEATELPALVTSLQSQVVEVPVALVVADNNSTDKTSEVVRQGGGNAIIATQQGAGAARQAGLRHALQNNPAAPDRTVIVQTDADSAPHAGYLDAAVRAFQTDPNMQVGVGPSRYTIPTESGEVLEIVGGKAYGDLLGTQSMRGYFEIYNRDAGDYMLEAPYRYLVGPNTTFRGSVFTDHHFGYKTDGRWEVLDLAVRLQQKFPSGDAIKYVEGQSMEVSPRAILGDSDVLTARRLSDIRAAGYVGMYKKDGSSHTPFTTMQAVLREIDAEVYDLPPNQEIVATVHKDHPAASVYDVRPALHAATGEALVGKVALIQAADL